MKKLYIDTEFNGFGGELISMAMIGLNGEEFYEVLELPYPIDPWVRDHVIPVLNNFPLRRKQFQEKFYNFFMKYGWNWEIIADYFADIRYFLQVFETMPIPSLRASPIFIFKVDRKLSSAKSKIPHNALEDAYAIRDSDIYASC